MVTTQEKLGNVDFTMECPKCHGTWIPRVRYPLACSRCKVTRATIQRHYHTDWSIHEKENI